MTNEAEVKASAVSVIQYVIQTLEGSKESCRERVASAPEELVESASSGMNSEDS